MNHRQRRRGASKATFPRRAGERSGCHGLCVPPQSRHRWRSSAHPFSHPLIVPHVPRGNAAPDARRPVGTETPQPRQTTDCSSPSAWERSPDAPRPVGTETPQPRQTTDRSSRSAWECIPRRSASRWHLNTTTTADDRSFLTLRVGMHPQTLRVPPALKHHNNRRRPIVPHVPPWERSPRRSASPQIGQIRRTHLIRQ